MLILFTHTRDLSILPTHIFSKNFFRIIMITSLFSHKKVGILGFGKTGQSFLSLIMPYNPALISVTQHQELDHYQQHLLSSHGARWVPYELLPQFLEAHDLILPSPGIDLTPYQDYQDKFISELDLFAQLVQIPTVAITGSVGKTTTVTFLTELLNKLGKKALACGNIGIPLLDVIPNQKQYDVLVIELSSFQLEQSTRFAPDYAGLTTLFANHLDRHKTMDAYAQAKGKLFSFQTENQHAVIPLCYYDMLWDSVNHQKVEWITPDYMIDIIKPISDITAVQNWQIIFTIIDSMGLSITKAVQHAHALTRPVHRMELVGKKDTIRFYNDSKSTVPEATLQALQQAPADSPIILFLGGISKGINRQTLCHSLGNNIKHVICFGKEADILYRYCQQAGVPSTPCTDFEEAWTVCTQLVQEHDTVLFSPSGASFDLFKDYEHRGNTFKAKVKEYVGQQ